MIYVQNFHTHTFTLEDTQPCPSTCAHTYKTSASTQKKQAVFGSCRCLAVEVIYGSLAHSSMNSPMNHCTCSGDGRQGCVTSFSVVWPCMTLFCRILFCFVFLLCLCLVFKVNTIYWVEVCFSFHHLHISSGWPAAGWRMMWVRGWKTGRQASRCLLLELNLKTH